MVKSYALFQVDKCFSENISLEIDKMVLMAINWLWLLENLHHGINVTADILFFRIICLMKLEGC